MQAGARLATLKTLNEIEENMICPGNLASQSLHAAGIDCESDIKARVFSLWAMSVASVDGLISGVTSV